MRHRLHTVFRRFCSAGSKHVRDVKQLEKLEHWSVPKTAEDEKYILKSKSVQKGYRYFFAGLIFVTTLGWLNYVKQRQIDSEENDYQPSKPPPSEKQRIDRFAEISPCYDHKVDADEYWLGYKKWRKKIIEKAHGLTLEVCAGTGRNLKYYKPNCDVVLTDVCEKMLKQAKSKPMARKEIFKQFLVEDACKLSFEDNTFDTVIDTFGLCSIEDPMLALLEMHRVCKPGGKILLLEHGNSSFKPIARMMENGLNRHLHLWGCYYNRNILEYVETFLGMHDDLGIDYIKRKHFGTTYWIEISKRPEGLRRYKSPFEIKKIPKKPTLLFFQTFVHV